MAIPKNTLAKILDDIASGKPMHVAVADSGISNGTFYRHLDAHPDDAERYARARETRNDRMAEDTLRVADDLGIPPEHKRIMVEARKWLLSKLAPKKYGERTVIAGDADNPLAITEVADPKATLLRGLTPKLAGGGTPGEGGSADR